MTLEQAAAAVIATITAELPLRREGLITGMSRKEYGAIAQPRLRAIKAFEKACKVSTDAVAVKAARRMVMDAAVASDAAVAPQLRAGGLTPMFVR